MKSRRDYFASHPFDILLDRAVREMALDKWGEQSNRIFDTSTSATVLMRTIDQYLDVASLSLDRRAAYDHAAAAAGDDKENWAHGGADRHQLFTSRSRAEIHWFLISVNSVGKCFEKLQARTAALKMASARKMWREHRQLFFSYREVRDHIEHGDERIIGEKQDSLLVRRQRAADNVAVIDASWEFPFPGVLKIGSAQCDISPAGLQHIERIVGDLKDAMREECLDIVVAHTTESGLPFQRDTPPWEPETAMRDTESKPGDNVIFYD